MKACAVDGEALSADGPPTVVTGRALPGRHREIDGKWPWPGPMYGVVKRMNLWTSPFVPSTSAAAEASGVSVAGWAPASTAATSLTRSCNSRFSFLLYCAAETQVRMPVTSSPTIRIATAAQYGQRSRVTGSAAGASPGSPIVSVAPSAVSIEGISASSSSFDASITRGTVLPAMPRLSRLANSETIQGRRTGPRAPTKWSMTGARESCTTLARFSTRSQCTRRNA